MSEGVQTQTSPHGAQTSAQRREAVSVLQVPETLLPFGFLQSAHEPPLLLLQAVQRIIPKVLLVADPQRYQ